MKVRSLKRENFNVIKYPCFCIFLHEILLFFAEEIPEVQLLGRAGRFAFTIEDVVFTGSTLQVSSGKSSLA